MTYSITVANIPGNTKPTNAVDFGWVVAKRNTFRYMVPPRALVPFETRVGSTCQNIVNATTNDTPSSLQQHPHSLLHPLHLDRLPQPLPYLPTSIRNRQPTIPVPPIPQLSLNTHRHFYPDSMDNWERGADRIKVHDSVQRMLK